MSMTIRSMTIEDKSHVMEMMKTFYASPAVWSNGSEEIFAADIENCVNDSPYLEGMQAICRAMLCLPKAFPLNSVSNVSG